MDESEKNQINERIPMPCHIKYYVMPCNLHQNMENLKFGVDGSIIVWAKSTHLTNNKK
jgi:hypothetical protein